VNVKRFLLATLLNSS